MISRKTAFSAIAAVFFCAPARAAVQPCSLMGLQWSVAESAPEDVQGVILAEPENLRLKGVILTGGQEVALGRAPDAEVELAPLFNRQWMNAHVFDSGPDRFYLSVTFNSAGDAYLSVMYAGWSTPYFYKFERGLSGRFQTPNGTYSVELDASLFRARLSNYVVVKKDGTDEPVYKRRIKELLLSAYQTGRPVAIGGKAPPPGGKAPPPGGKAPPPGGRTYNLFYSYDLDMSKTPVVIDRAKFGIVLIYDAYDSESGEHDFHAYVIPQGDLGGGKIKMQELYEGRRVGVQLGGPDGTTLRLYDLTKDEIKKFEDLEDQ